MRLSQSHDIWMTGSEMSYDDFVTPCGYLGRYGCAWAASSGGAGTRPVTNGYPIKADIGHPGPDSLTLSNGVDARGRGTARASSFRELGLPSRGRRRRDALPATAGRRWSDGRWQSSQAGLLEHQSGPTLAYGDAEKSRRSALGGTGEVARAAPRRQPSGECFHGPLACYAVGARVRFPGGSTRSPGGLPCSAGRRCFHLIAGGPMMLSRSLLAILLLQLPTVAASADDSRKSSRFDEMAEGADHAARPAVSSSDPDWRRVSVRLTGGFGRVAGWRRQRRGGVLERWWLVWSSSCAALVVGWRAGWAAVGLLGFLVTVTLLMENPLIRPEGATWVDFPAQRPAHGRHVAGGPVGVPLETAGHSECACPCLGNGGGVVGGRAREEVWNIDPRSTRRMVTDGIAASTAPHVLTGQGCRGRGEPPEAGCRPCRPALRAWRFLVLHQRAPGKLPAQRRLRRQIAGLVIARLIRQHPLDPQGGAGLRGQCADVAAHRDRDILNQPERLLVDGHRLVERPRSDRDSEGG